MDYNKKDYLELVRYNAKLAGYKEKIYESDKKDKKFYIIDPDGKKIYFGANTYPDFLIYLLTEGEEEALRKREMYRNRHSDYKKEKYTPGGLSWNILW